jgi:hypothetical protein
MEIARQRILFVISELHSLKNGDPGGMGIQATFQDGKQLRLNGGAVGVDGPPVAAN